MKTTILTLFTILALIYTHIPGEPGGHIHTFLVKTDLTKEQVQTLLNQYHQNQNQHPQQNLHQNTTTLVKNEETAQNTTHNHQETQLHSQGNTIHNHQTTQLKEKNEKEAEVQETPEVPEVSEAPEVEQNEQVNLKKKGKKEKVPEVIEPVTLKTPEIPETPETPVTPESETSELTKQNNLLVNGNSIEEPETAEDADTETENDTLILVNKNKEQITQQCSNKFLGFLSSILFTIVFIALLIYATQPKKKSKIYGRNLDELSDYLLIKEIKSKEYDLRDF